MGYVLGLDVGGTKTYCLIADEAGHVAGFGRAGTGNYEYHGVGPASKENRKAIDMALQEAGLTLADIVAVGMGVAGADLPEDYVMLERELYGPLLGDIPRVFKNDSMAGLRGGNRYGVGISINCGTGCVCAGKNEEGEEARAGGLGAEFGDLCTGTDIGNEGIRTVWRARDGIIPPTTMTERFVTRSGCDGAEELFYKLYRQQLTYADLQPMAKIVFEAAFDGDSAACGILEVGGKSLGAMVNAVAHKLGMTQSAFDVVMAGSVFKGVSPVLIDAMTEIIHRVCPKANTVLPAFEPVVGALLLGMEIDRPVSDETYRTLSEDLARAQVKYSVAFTAE